MDGFEVYIMTECKKLKQDIENTVKDNKEISDFIDSESNKRYLQLLNTSNNVMEVIGKMNDVHNACDNVDNYCNILNVFFTAADDALKYFSNYEKVSGKIIKDIMFPLIQEKMDKINEMILGTGLYSNQRISHNLQFQQKILIENIIRSLNEILVEVWNTYVDLCRETVIKTTDRIKIKNNEILSYVSDDNILPEVQHQKLEKILDTRKMDKWLFKHNFQPSRQGSTSHRIYKNKTDSIAMPMHGKKLNKGLAYTIQKEIFKKNKKIS